MPSLVSSATVAAATCALALGAGCGDDDDGGGSSGPLTRAEYLAQADAICKRVNAEIKELPQPSSLTDFATLTTVADRGLELTDQGISGLEELKPPEEIAADVEEAADLRRQQRGRVAALQAAAKAKDPKAVEAAVTAAARLDDRSNTIAKRIGLRECGKE